MIISECNYNPLKFIFQNDQVKFKFGRYINNYGKSLYVKNTEVGKYYLKCSFKILFRSHSGYCSEQEEDNYECEEEKIVKLYFNIPDVFLNSNGEINNELINDDSNLIYNDDTKILFEEWEVSSCSGVCGYTDLYTPILFEYVTITE